MITIHCLTLFLADALILANEEVEVLIRAFDGADLVIVIDEIAGKT